MYVNALKLHRILGLMSIAEDNLEGVTFPVGHPSHLWQRTTDLRKLREDSFCHYVTSAERSSEKPINIVSKPKPTPPSCTAFNDMNQPNCLQDFLQ